MKREREDKSVDKTKQAGFGKIWSKRITSLETNGLPNQ